MSNLVIYTHLALYIICIIILIVGAILDRPELGSIIYIVSIIAAVVYLINEGFWGVLYNEILDVFALRFIVFISANVIAYVTRDK